MTGVAICGLLAAVCGELMVLVVLGLFLKVSRFQLYSLCEMEIFMCFHFIVAQKTGYWNFYSIIRPFAILWLLAFILRLFTRTDIWMLIPFCFIWVTASLLRFHLTRVYSITENGDCGECLIAFWCLPCSISQSKFQSVESVQLTLLLSSHHNFPFVL